MISVIIIKTNDAQYSEAVSYIDKQDCATEVEIIEIDNAGNKAFSSAAKALNYGANKAKGDVLVFMHQDIYLWENNVLQEYYDYVSKHKDVVVGVAGKSAEDVVYGDIYETKNKIKRLKPTCGQKVEVISLDECMFAMHRELWESIKFDEKCCNNWHGYAVDFCLANSLRGGHNVVFSFPICHESKGNTNQRQFFMTIKHMIKKYRKTDIKRIMGTCINIRCSILVFYKYYFNFYYRYNIKHIIKKFLMTH